jgi:hypothetical protein
LNAKTILPCGVVRVSAKRITSFSFLPAISKAIQMIACTPHQQDPEFPISTSSVRENHTPAALVRQVQIDVGAAGLHRGSFGNFADLFRLFLSSNQSGR